MENNYYYRMNPPGNNMADYSLNQPSSSVIQNQGFNSFRTSSNIHINPLIPTGYQSSLIKVALSIKNNSGSCNPIKNEACKIDRIHYNPKFLKNTNISTDCQKLKNNSDLPRKQEKNIYINPHFTRKQNNCVQNTTVTTTTTQLPISKSDLPTHGGIHINPKFYQKRQIALINSQVTTVQVVPNDKNEEDEITKYKLVRNKENAFSGVETMRKAITEKKIKSKTDSPKQPVQSQRFSLNGKYFKTYMDKQQLLSFKNSQPAAVTSFDYNSKILKSSPKSFPQKRIMRRKVMLPLFYNDKNSLSTKYRYRAPGLSCQVSQKLLYDKHHFKNIDKTLKDTSLGRSAFKKISNTKLVRKSVLQSKIEARRYARISSTRSQCLWKKAENQLNKSMPIYKVDHSTNSLKINSVYNNKTIPTTTAINQPKVLQNVYRKNKLKRLHILTKKLRKNNKPCIFYNRYGRCKGIEKGSCPLVHDPKFVAICKEFLKGECKVQNCTLSHDVRPEKMPTCYHYLAGLCHRTNCSYLHIKVNKKAPICRSFLMGFCEDVYNCKKRHEYICPNYAEKGICPKGKSCSWPHRTPKLNSQLLEPDQFPLLNYKPNKANREPKVSITIKHLDFKKNCRKKKIPSFSDNNKKEIPSVSDNIKKEITPVSDDTKKDTREFKRYFLMSLSESASTEDSEFYDEKIITHNQ